MYGLLLFKEKHLVFGSPTCLRIPHVTKAMLGQALFHRLCFLDGSGSQLTGSARAAASAGKGRRPHPRFCSKRLRFWPEAIIRASQLTRQSRRKRKHPMLCHCFPSANSGSTQTFRLFRAFW